jgi:hypothetical protein
MPAARVARVVVPLVLTYLQPKVFRRIGIE